MAGGESPKSANTAARCRGGLKYPIAGLPAGARPSWPQRQASCRAPSRSASVATADISWRACIIANIPCSGGYARIKGDELLRRVRHKSCLSLRHPSLPPSGEFPDPSLRIDGWRYFGSRTWRAFFLRQSGVRSLLFREE